MTADNMQVFTRRIANANKTEMMVILYDIALTYIEDAEKALENGDKKDFRLQVVRIKNTMRELMNSVNPSVEPGRTIMSIYIFCNGELTKAYGDCENTGLENVKKLMLIFRDTYAECAKLDRDESVMEHTEVVYTGLTYNKNSYSENVSAVDAGRGFLA